jgi:acetoin utilization protein AcuB
MHVLPTMLMPSIGRYMTTNPKTIERTASLADAHQLMRANNLRHLPVVDGGRLVGIVSERDLHLLETIAEFPLESVPVDEAATERPFIATSDMALDDVVEIMADHKYGSVIVMGHDGIEGIFTLVDACRALVDVLRQQTAVDTSEPPVASPS